MRDQKVAAKRANFILLVGGGLFVVTFLVIFFAMRDSDGSSTRAWSAMLGIVFGIPVACVVAAFGTAIAFQWTADRGPFDESDIDDDEKKADQ